MSLGRDDNPGDIQVTRWVARGLSLLFIMFVLMLFVLNEDFRESPTLSTVVLWILTLCMLIAWRWEKAGGMLILVMSPVFLLSFFIQWYRTGELITPFWQIALVGAAWVLSFLIVGWLFFRLGKLNESKGELSQGGEPAAKGSKRYHFYAATGLLGLLAVILFFVPFFIPVQQRFEFPDDRFLPAGYDQLVDDLDSLGGVVSLGGTPVKNPLFSVEGREINVDGESLQAFHFTNIESATADASAIYGGENSFWEEIDWTDTPHIYQVKDVLVFYAGSDDAVLAKLETIFGPPFIEGN